VSRDSSVSIMTRLRDARLGFYFRHGQRLFLFVTASRPEVGPTQPHSQWVKGAPSLGVKRKRREADHSPRSGAKVKTYEGVSKSFRTESITK
jgi:hypothetical protein